ncbi:MAG: TetR/AcrR family transcriptional regulator [Alphaproteobacteria bacterium]|nr:TetR/AcrR family transcriptional regulator [Alphaproteobacteria bacterium]
MVYKKSELRREKKVAEILDLALELVAEVGIDGLTVGALAEKLDWTKGALYRYFRSKDQLVAALNGRVIEAWAEEVEEVLAEHAASSARDRIVAVLDRFVDLAHERPTQFGMVSLTMADPRNLVAHIEDATHVPAMMELLGRIVRLVAEAAAEGDLAPGDPFGRTLQVVFGTLGVLQLKKLTRFDAQAFDTRGLAKRTGRDLLHAWAR